MRNFLYNLSYKYRVFMQGRYGSDELNLFLIILAVVFTLVSRTGVVLSFVFRFLSWVFLGIIFFRMFSKNISKRYEERMRFLRYKSSFVSFCNTKKEAWSNRKTHKYFKCKKCGANIRVPRHVGKIEVTCPKCRNKFIKKTGKRRQNL